MDTVDETRGAHKLFMCGAIFVDTYSGMLIWLLHETWDVGVNWSATQTPDQPVENNCVTYDFFKMYGRGNSGKFSIFI
jgi:hypothetical protein